MSSISSVASITASSVSSSVASSVDQLTIAALQLQLSVYFPAADGQNTQAKAAYQQLQSAVSLGDVSQAQAALAILQRVSQPTNPHPAAGVSSPSADNVVTHDSSGLNVKA